MTKLFSKLIIVSLLMFVTSAHALDLKTLISSGIINKLDSTGNICGLQMIDHGYCISISSRDQGKTDGLWINLDNLGTGKYCIDSFGVSENNQTQIAIILNNDGTVLMVVDNVQPINKKMFPAVYEAAEKCKDTEVGKYGMVQFYIRCYNDDDGSLKEEGWCCNFVEADNNFDYIADPLPIGVQKYYEDGKVIEKDETDKTIEGLLYYAEHYDEQRNFDCDHAE